MKVIGTNKQMLVVLLLVTSGVPAWAGSAFELIAPGAGSKTKSADAELIQAAPANPGSAEATCDELASHRSDNDRPQGVAPALRVVAPARAIAVCSEAIKSSPHLRRLFTQRARAYAFNKDDQAAEQDFKQAISLGSGRALAALALVYYDKKTEAGYVKALEYATLAVGRGIGAGYWTLGRLYRWGHGVPKDAKKAQEYLEKGAALGDLESNTELGRMYLLGVEVSADYPKARSYFQTGDPVEIVAGSLGPDAQQTLDFLSSNVPCDPAAKVRPGTAPYSHMRETTRVNSWFVGSFRVWRSVEEFSVDVYNSSKEIYMDSKFVPENRTVDVEANFENLSATLTVRENAIQITCAVPGCFQQHSYHTTTNGSCGKRHCYESNDSQTYRYCSAEKAASIAKAISHMIKINGGRESPF